jgi:hypothetical protein
MNLSNGINSAALNEMTRHAQKIGSRDREAINSTIFLAEFQRSNLASEFAKKLLNRIRDFDNHLNSDEEVGMRLVSFGQTVTFHVSNLTYYNPSIVIFIGHTDEGHKVELLQHVSQISFLLIALPRLNPDQPKRSIGFRQENT